MPSSPTINKGAEELEKLVKPENLEKVDKSNPTLSRETSVISPVQTLSNRLPNQVAKIVPNKEKSTIKVSKYGRDYLLSALGHTNVAIGQIETHQEQILPVNSSKSTETNEDLTPETNFVINESQINEQKSNEENKNSQSEPGNSKHIQRKREWNQEREMLLARCKGFGQR